MRNLMFLFNVYFVKLETSLISYQPFHKIFFKRTKLCYLLGINLMTRLDNYLLNSLLFFVLYCFLHAAELFCLALISFLYDGTEK